MSRQLERLARACYGSVLSSERGEVARDELEALGRALSQVEGALAVAAVWSAARAVVFPQLEPEAVARARASIAEILAPAAPPARAHGAHEPALSGSAGVEAPGVTSMAARRASAARSVASALCCFRTPNAALFADTVGHLADAQRDAAAPASRAKAQWLGWLDDVITRSDRCEPRRMVALLGRAVDGSLANLRPSRFFWEGVASERGPLEVWTADAATRRLVSNVLAFDQVKLAGDVLSVIVAERPDFVRDELRIEYLFEQEIHRAFLGASYAGRYRRIEFAFADGSGGWTLEA
ncbi:MAG TPA: hypothetical protein VMI54_15070 [Polyangiaceae bacterium]|nr:hypothetical protein [Polyangiaceae bacterium]